MSDRRFPRKLALPGSHLQRSIETASGSGGDGSFNSLVVALGASIGDGLGVGGDAVIGGTLTLNALTYTFPASQANHRVLHTDGAGTLSWAQVALDTEVSGLLPLANMDGSGAAGGYLRSDGTGWKRVTVSSLLTDLETVDGSGSGLDADLLDGNDSAFYQNAGNLNAGTLLSARLSGAYSGITGVGTLASGAVPASLVTAGTFGAGAYTFPSTLTVTGNFNSTSAGSTFGSNTASAVTVVLNAAAGSSRVLAWRTAGVNRWDIVGNNSAETGSDAGTALTVHAYTDAGATIDTVLSIARAAGGSITFSAARPIAGGTYNGQTISSAASFTGTVTAASTIQGTRLISTTATGTSPFAVTSTTVNTNLNADLLDGQHGSFYNDATNLTGTINTARLSGSYTGITGVGTLTAGTWNAGVISEAYGGTNQSSYTLGDILYASAANTLSKLAGNTTTTKKFLTQTGTGAVSAAPAWAQVDFADLSGTIANGQVSGSYTGITGVGTLSAGAVPLSLVTAGTSPAGTFTFPTLAASTRLTAPLIGTTTATDVVFDRNGTAQLTLSASLATFVGSITIPASGAINLGGGAGVTCVGLTGSTGLFISPGSGTMSMVGKSGGSAATRLSGDASVGTGAYLDLWGTTHANAGRVDLASGGTAELRLLPGGSLAIGAAGSFGSGVKVIFIANATTDPTSNPTGGGILYVSGGALKYRGSSGTVTTIAAA